MINTKCLSNCSCFDDFNSSSCLKRLFCVSLSDELFLKRSLSLIYSSLCQIARFVEIKSNACRDFEFRSECLHYLDYCEADKRCENVNQR